MQLTYKFYIEHTDQLDNLFRASNNLYNQALYTFRQKLVKEEYWIWYNEMDKIIKHIPNLEGEYNYKILGSTCSQQVLRVLDKNIKAFCKAIKDWKKNPHKYKGRPKLPQYLPKGGMHMLMYTYNAARIKNCVLCLPFDIQIEIPQYEKYKEYLDNLKLVRILPHKNDVCVEIIYNKEPVIADVDDTIYAAIDLGIDNLATMVTPSGCEIWSGKFIKSYNQHYNKMVANYRSIKDLQGIKGHTNRLYNMDENRNKYLHDVMHKISRQIVNRLIELRIGNLVVGYNKSWKSGIDIGSVNNQKFTSIPFNLLTSMLKYKCEMAGIQYIENEESYTSKCDALALEPIQKHDKYAGRRVKRGLFKSSTGQYINADQNGALNILRKVVGDSEFSRLFSKGHSLSPIRHKTPF